MSANQQQGRYLVGQILRAIGEDPEREGLLETPARVVESWRELFAGYDADPGAMMKTFADGAEGIDEMVLLTDLPVRSHCEHHMVPFIGVAHVAYIPNGKIVGLSKLPRVVDAFSRRLQVQERLTKQIADCIEEALDPIGVAVFLECEHFCMAMRGVKCAGIKTQTSDLRGAFRTSDSARAEFMSRLPRPR